MARTIPSLKRRQPNRDPKQRFVLYCEGKNTEPAYFDALKRHFCGAVVDVQTVKAAGQPMTIAENATKAATSHRRSRKNSYELQDQFWAVFDRDEHPYYEEAVKRCQQGGVGVARSNPCFEIWLILHHQDFDRPDDHHLVQRHFAGLAPEYDPKGAKQADCDALMKNIDAAERRAENQLSARQAEGAPFGAPSTTVHHLTRAIRTAAESNKKKTS